MGFTNVDQINFDMRIKVLINLLQAPGLSSKRRSGVAPKNEKHWFRASAANAHTSAAMDCFEIDGWCDVSDFQYIQFKIADMQ